MGFDLYGQRPSSCNIAEPDWNGDVTEAEAEEYWKLINTIPGAYFRASVWSWRPLWNYVSAVCKDILTDSDIDLGCYNDNHLISNDKARRMAVALKQDINKNNHVRFAKWQKQRHKEMPLETCSICEGKGTRKGWDGWESKEEWIKIHGSLDIGGDEQCSINFKGANNHKGCNACKGEGKRESFITNYEFYPDFLEEFESFCRLSGGFVIK